MDPTVIVALIAAVPTTLALVGKSASCIIGLVQDKGKSAIDAKNAELSVKDERIAILEEKVSERDGTIEEREKRIAYLESRLAEEGVTT